MSIKKICKNCGREFSTDFDYLNYSKRWRMCSRGNLWFNCECNSTLLLTAKQFDWYDPTLGMNSNTKNIFTKLKEKDQLPYIKSVVLEIQELLETPNIEINLIVKKIKMEPIIASEILVTANRLIAIDNPDKKISDLNHAVVYTGLKKLKEVVLAITLKEIKLNTLYFKTEEFWERSFSRAIVLEYLAKKYAPYQNTDELYLAGFLMDIGKLVSAFYYPEKVDKITLAYKKPKNRLSWTQLEDLYECDPYLAMSEIACALWGLPETVLQCCSSHLKYNPTNTEHLSINDLAVFADQLTHWISYEICDIDNNILESLCHRLNITMTDLESSAAEISNIVTKSQSQQTDISL